MSARRPRIRPGRGRAALAGLACALAAAAALGFVPKAERVESAVAETNRAARRTTPLQLDVALRIGEGAPVARGELVTHPQGLARLELRGAGGLVERHVLQGTEHRASRNGRPVASPRPFLPPIFLLQADSAATLRAELRSFGVRVDTIGLAPCGERDCYVVGDPTRAVSPPAAPGDAPAGSAEPGAPEPLRVVPGSDSDDLLGPARVRIWIDVESFELRRIDFEGGLRVRLGPTAAFERIRFPQWIQIDDPERGPVRLDVERVAAVAASAAAFGDSWLSSPTEPSPDAPSGAGDLAPGAPGRPSPRP